MDRGTQMTTVQGKGTLKILNCIRDKTWKDKYVVFEHLFRYKFSQVVGQQDILILMLMTGGGHIYLYICHVMAKG